MTRATKLMLICLCLVGLTFCTGTNAKSDRDTNKSFVFTTTGMLADAVENLMGDKVHVQAMMGPGIDPHLYKAKPSDLESMKNADVIVFSGLHLEGKLFSVLKQPLFEQKAINFSDGIQKENLIKISGNQDANYLYDPHIWFDLSLWSEGIAQLSEKLQTIYPQWAEEITENTIRYISAIGELDSEIMDMMAKIPESRRVLVTSHDAFHYFGRRYGVEVEALQGISTATDFGIQDRKQLVELIVARKIKAIFIESSVNPQPIQAVLEDCKSKGVDVVIGGTLYSDAMGAKGSEAGTYIGMMKSNADKIWKGLCADEEC